MVDTKFKSCPRNQPRAGGDKNWAEIPAPREKFEPEIPALGDT